VMNRFIRASYWASAIILGGAQTWYVRHRIISDGVSYLAIAQAYLRGDWHNAINGYWSPLYSWVIAGYLAIFKPSPYWQVSSLHVINFLAFLAACWVFERFLNALLGEESRAPESGAEHSTILIAGYCTVLFGGLTLIGIGYVSPDMVAYVFTGLLAWLTVLIYKGERKTWVFIVFGATLGLGYLDRSAFAFLAGIYVLAVIGNLLQQKSGIIRPLALILGAGLIVGGPFVFVLSTEKRTLTLGEAGKLNYGWEVAGALRSTHWQGEPGDIGTPVHPTRKILTNPVPVYEFSEPVSGSYPPWYDPSYWYEGIRPYFKLAPQLQRLRSNLIMTMLVTFACPAAAAAAVLLLACWRNWREVRTGLARNWAVLLPPLAGIATYCLVFVDRRYIAGFLAVLWISVIYGLRHCPRARDSRVEVAARLLCLIVFAGLCLARMGPDLNRALIDLAHRHETYPNFNWILAERFRNAGVKDGERIAFAGLSMNADWVRLMQSKIVAEVPIVYDRQDGWRNYVIPDDKDILAFGKLSHEEMEIVLSAFRRAGAVIAVADRLPAKPVQEGWTRLIEPNSPYIPTHDGQFPDGSDTCFRWLNEKP
jgi:hypothetical protein